MDPIPNVTQGPPQPNFYSECPFIVPRYTVTIVDFIPLPLPNPLIPQEMIPLQDMTPGTAQQMVPLPTQEMALTLPLPQQMIAINPASAFYYTYDWIFPPGPVLTPEPPVPSWPELRPTEPSRANTQFCALCKSNGETRDIYDSHILKNYKSRTIVCPVLRQLVCPTCGSTGDNAHTLKYCPVQKANNASKRVPREGQPVRNSTGKWSQLKY